MQNHNRNTRHERRRQWDVFLICRCNHGHSPGAHSFTLMWMLVCWWATAFTVSSAKSFFAKATCIGPTTITGLSAAFFLCWRGIAGSPFDCASGKVSIKDAGVWRRWAWDNKNAHASKQTNKEFSSLWKLLWIAAHDCKVFILKICIENMHACVSQQIHICPRKCHAFFQDCCQLRSLIIMQASARTSTTILCVVHGNTICLCTDRVNLHWFVFANSQRQITHCRLRYELDDHHLQ